MHRQAVTESWLTPGEVPYITRQTESVAKPCLVHLEESGGRAPGRTFKEHLPTVANLKLLRWRLPVPSARGVAWACFSLAHSGAQAKTCHRAADVTSGLPTCLIVGRALTGKHLPGRLIAIATASWHCDSEELESIKCL